jgi:hypothetical protein
MSIGALAFLSPWLLGALVALPVIYWLLRTVPPRPRQIAFPPTRILIGLENKDKTPAKTPWWLTLIRMLAAALVIFALADPVLNPHREAGLGGTGPLVLVVDNGWSSASHFAHRAKLVERIIDEAQSSYRPVIVAPTAPSAKTLALRAEAPIAARTTAAALQPQPFPPLRAELADQLSRLLTGQTGIDVVWLSDGIDHDGQAVAFANVLGRLAGTGGRLQVITNRAGDEPLGVSATLDREGKLEASIIRAEGSARHGTALAFSARGQRLAEAPYEIAAGNRKAAARFELPLELRNQVARVELAGERSAGTVHLLDSRSRWHRVALVSGESREQAQPLLAPLYYIEKALAPFAELVRQKDVNLAAAVSGAFEQKSSILIMADIGTLAGEVQARVEEWLNNGGVLVRFAGPRLEKGGDELLPVGLRVGGRTLGGALSWSTPQPLAPFDDTSLFAGLPIPPEVTVNRQILADPAFLTDEVSVWARLADGTPLVTARKHGEGQIVLFHITANSDWSNLPLSGLFVEMLRRVATLGKSGGVAVGGVETLAGATASAPAAENTEVLAPTQVLDGYGTLRPPTPTAQAIPARRIDTQAPSLDHPPGYYGPATSPRALNVVTPRSELKPLPHLPNVEQRTYEGTNPEPLKPWLLSLALALIFLDIVAVLLLQGLLSARRRPRPATATAALLIAVVAALAFAATAANAQQSRPRAAPPPPPPPAVSPMPSSRDMQMAIQATGKVTFAYVLTGDSSTDDTSRAGLVGMGRVLAARTTVEPGEPFGVNVVTDEIAFFPILYWPVLANANPLPDATLAKIDTYMKQGGMIIFDTRDFGAGLPTGVGMGRDGGTPLQRLLGRLDIPRLEPVPEGHVLTKSFYILRTFPGRWDGGQMWVEADSSEPADGDTRKARRADGVSSILVTPNDLAAAWALDDRFRPLYPTVPGGEAQREMSYRVGINIIMYALTGNYKADQVHAPALIERLGQ